jgi:TIR domain
MALFTASYFRNINNTLSKSFNNNLLFNQNNQRDQFDIFLSHSFLDKDIVEGIYRTLIELGYSVYVDWIVDSKLNRSNVTKESAEMIRNRMRSSKSLIMALSENSDLSKWIPWELGFVDGHTNSQCALLPITSNTSTKTFLRSEYLKIYPYIKSITTSLEYNHAVIVESSNAFTSFESWIKYGSKPSYQNINVDSL